MTNTQRNNVDGAIKIIEKQLEIRQSFSSDDLKIAIIGCSGSGKSSLQYIINDHLNGLDINSNIILDDDFADMEHYNDLIKPTLHNRIEMLKTKNIGIIDIETIQSNNIIIS